MTTIIDYDRMTQSLQAEFFSVYENVELSKKAGDDKKYKSWLDALWKVSRVLIDLKNLERNLDQSTTEEEDEFAKLLDKLQQEDKTNEKTLMR